MARGAGRASTSIEHKQLFSYHDVIGLPQASVAFGNGTSDSLSEENLTAEKLRNLLAVGGFSPERKIALPTSKGESHLRLRWFNCLACAVWVVAFGLLLRQAVQTRQKRRERSVEAANANRQEVSITAMHPLLV